MPQNLTPETESQREDLYRKLPSVNEVLLTPAVQKLVGERGHARVVEAVRSVLASMRVDVAEGKTSTSDLEARILSIARVVSKTLSEKPPYSLRPVINATGVILHTNLGRAPLSEAALAHVVEVARDYCNLEFDVTAGERSKRDVHVESLVLRVLGIAGDETSRWSVVIVNNCAAATFLALNSLADRREVLVSRGELVEIGGGFRIPEILEKSGAVLREVGTTNRTRAEDYENAVNEQTALLLRVHQSNFSIEGFVERPSLNDLVQLSRTLGVPLFEDQGTGLISRLEHIGISGQPVIQDSVAAGVDLIAASGDKLLGGPQCGLLIGRTDLIAKIRKNPLLRAFRVDKLTYAALEATLFEYLAGPSDALPLARMLRVPAIEIEKRCNAIAASIRSERVRSSVVEVESIIGGGTAPSATLKSFAISLQHRELGADELLRKLRECDPPLIGRIAEDAVLLDLRAVPAHLDDSIICLLERL